ncbi:MAG TPA: glycosyltransferase [Sphingomicrobium sp.]|nr:glycosyltransferase [Sphingomicrobium sp.]
MADSSVAIVIPCFNQRHFLSAAIESALDQTVAANEIIVIDDGSTEDLSSVTSSYPQIELIRQENRGLAAARNAGAKAATSDRLIFLDSDDRLLPDAVRRGLECFAAHPDAAFIYGACRIVQGKSQWSRFTAANSHLDLIRCNWIVCPASAMFDRSKLLVAGGFDETLGMCEDWDAFLRLSRAHPFAFHQEPVVLYFKHGSNMSNDEAELLRWVEVVRQKEKARGLNERELQAWEEGEAVWRSFYERRPDTLLRRLARKLRRWLIGR